MATAVGKVDELVKDYLLFRGLTSTVKSLENELKNDKEKGLRADKILEQIQQYIAAYDLHGLRDYWLHLSQRFFARLEQRYMPAVRKLEVSLLKYYIVYAAQNNRHDRVVDFFDKMTYELQKQKEFQEWFSFAFLRNPEESSTFSVYFTRAWQDTFFLSLHNFLSVILQAMPEPTLLNFEIDRKRLHDLHAENERLRKQLADRDSGATYEKRPLDKKRSHTGVSSLELMDDFYNLSGETGIEHEEKKEKKRFPISFTSSPKLLKKPSVKKIDPPVSKPPEVKSLKIKAKLAKEDSVTTKGVPMSMMLAPPVIQLANTAALVAKVDDNSGGILKKQQQEMYDRQRRELLGDTANAKEVKKVNNEEGSVDAPMVAEMAPVTATPPSPDKRATETVSAAADIKNTDVQNPMPYNLDQSSSSPGPDCPFLLLSQEEYCEHHSAISLCRFSNSGQYVASSDVDGVVKVWSWNPQPVTIATVMSKSAFLSLEWASKFDRWLLLGNKSGNIRLFDVRELKSFYEVAADTSYPRIVSLCMSPSSHQFTCSSTINRFKPPVSKDGNGVTLKQGRLSVWDLKTMKLEKYLPMDSSLVAVNCTAYNHNGHLLVTGAADGRIRLFDMQQHKCIAAWMAHEGEVLSAQFSCDETTCYSMGSDGKFLQWSLTKPGTKLCDLSVHSAVDHSVLTGSGASKESPRGRLFSFDSEGQYVLTCAKSGGTIYKMNATIDMSRVMDIRGHINHVTTVDWSPSIETRVCLTGSLDSRIRVSTLLSQ